MATTTKTKLAASSDQAGVIANRADTNNHGADWVAALNVSAAVERLAPTYKCVPVIGGFRCEVILAGVVAEASGPSRATAKREAARAWVKHCCD